MLYVVSFFLFCFAQTSTGHVRRKDKPKRKKEKRENKKV
jgi:hypothetical protein